MNHEVELTSPESAKEQLDPEVKKEFMKAWRLSDGEMTDEQILMAIHLGHF